MEKQQLIALIESEIAAGVVTREELLSLAGGQSIAVAQSETTPVAIDHSKNMTTLLYGIGAIIAIAGVTILVGQNWEEIGFMGRILSTLGISFATYGVGCIAGVRGQQTLSRALFVISALLAPLGSYVLLDEATIEFTLIVQAIVAAILAIVYGVALFVTRQTLLLPVVMGFATWWYYAIIQNALPGQDVSAEDVLRLATLLLGVSYILIAYGCRSWLVPQDQQKQYSRVQDSIYGTGTIAVLGAGMSFGGIFDLLLIIPIFGAFYASTYLKSRAMLLVGALFLMGHIVNLTSKYFIDTIGWPLALIMVGFLIIGIGYGTFTLSKKMST